MEPGGGREAMNVSERQCFAGQLTLGLRLGRQGNGMLLSLTRTNTGTSANAGCALVGIDFDVLDLLLKRVDR